MLDLKKTNLSAQAEEGYRFELLIPELNDPTGAFITVRGAQSPTVKAHAKSTFNRMQAEAKRAKRAGREQDDYTLDEMEQMSIDSAYVRIIGWEGIEEDGKEVKFTEDNVKRILRDHVWIREAVIKESDNLLNFIKS